MHIIAAMDLPETLEMVKICVDSGADTNAKDVHGRTPLHFAAGTDNVDLVKYLISEAKSDINAVTEGGETALIKAVNFGKTAIASELLDLKADPTLKTFVSIVIILSLKFW